MRIADYAEQVRAQILQNPHIVSHAFAYEDRASVAGLLKGTLIFSDGSRFHFKEFVRLSGAIVRLKYAYQSHDLSGSLATVADPLYRNDVHQPLLYTQRSYLSADCDGMPLRRCLNPG
jgi:hypothetical protein